MVFTILFKPKYFFLSSFSSEWLTLSQCIIHRVKLGAAYRSRCIRRLQGNSEFVHYAFYRHKSSPRFWRHFCCVYNDWEDCIVDELTRECGSGAGVIFSRLIHSGSLGLLSGLCTRSAFNPNDELQCVPEDTQAPAQYVPKGLHSTSLVSWLFSYACPNVSVNNDETKWVKLVLFFGLGWLGHLPKEGF